MSFSVALAVDNFAGVEEVGHPVLSPVVSGQCYSVLRGREVSVEKHCASRALAQVSFCCAGGPFGSYAARKPRLGWLEC